MESFAEFTVVDNRTCFAEEMLVQYIELMASGQIPEKKTKQSDREVAQYAQYAKRWTLWKEAGHTTEQLGDSYNVPYTQSAKLRKILIRAIGMHRQTPVLGSVQAVGYCLFWLANISV